MIKTSRGGGALRYLDATGNYSVPSETNYKYLRADGQWAAPSSDWEFYDACGEWSVPELSHIYGVRFPGFPSVTKGERADAAASFGDVHPALSNGTGDSPFDDIYPWCEMTTEERHGGTMVKVPKFYYKLTQDGACVYIQIADQSEDGFVISPSHMDRNDGKGERQQIYVGRYHCAQNTYMSTTGAKPQAGVIWSDAFKKCQSVGEGYYMMDFATRFTLWLLYLVEMAEWNSQDQIGFGCGNKNYAGEMGYSDDMEYCTGTTQADRTTQEIGTQWRNIEGLWDNVYDYLSGCYNDRNGLNVLIDANKLGNMSGGKLIGTPVNGTPSELKVSDSGGFPSFYPSSGIRTYSATTGTCDGWNFTEASYPVIMVGGRHFPDIRDGMFAVCHTANSTGYSDQHYGTRLMELP